MYVVLVRTTYNITDCARKKTQCKASFSWSMLQECSTTEGCNYYTFYSDTAACLLWTTCDPQEETCDTCITSQPLCDN